MRSTIRSFLTVLLFLFIIQVPIAARESNPVQEAVESGDVKRVETLLSKAENAKWLQVVNDDDETILYSVMSFPMLDLLVKKGAPVRKDDKMLLYIIIDAWASSYRGMLDSEKAFKLLLDRGVDPRGTLFESDMTLLHQSASMNSSEITRMLLEKGVDANRKDADGNIPLHDISVNFDFETRFVGKKIDLLLKAGNDINARNNNEQTPLHRAVREIVGETAIELLKRGADINLQDAYGYTPLHDALQEQNDMKLLTYMIQKGGADFSIKNTDGNTAEDLLRKNTILSDNEKSTLRTEIQKAKASRK